MTREIRLPRRKSRERVGFLSVVSARGRVVGTDALADSPSEPAFGHCVTDFSGSPIVRLEKFDGIAGGVFEQYLVAADTVDNVVAEMGIAFEQLRDRFDEMETWSEMRFQPPGSGFVLPGVAWPPPP